jgi:hypothetical protein
LAALTAAITVEPTLPASTAAAPTATPSPLTALGLGSISWLARLGRHSRRLPVYLFFNFPGSPFHLRWLVGVCHGNVVGGLGRIRFRLLTLRLAQVLNSTTGGNDIGQIVVVLLQIHKIGDVQEGIAF